MIVAVLFVFVSIMMPSVADMNPFEKRSVFNVLVTRIDNEPLWLSGLIVRGKASSNSSYGLVFALDSPSQVPLISIDSQSIEARHVL